MALINIRVKGSVRVFEMHELETDLITATVRNDILGVIECIDKGADVNYNEGGWTALMYACWLGYDEIVELLIENCDALNLDVNFSHPDGHTALTLAESYGHGHGHKHIVDLLKSVGARG